jgi:hypothetical protein
VLYKLRGLPEPARERVESIVRSPGGTFMASAPSAPTATRRDGVIHLLVLFALCFGTMSEVNCANSLAELRERRAELISVPSETVLPANEGKLVHVTGPFRPPSAVLTDPEFGVSAEGFALVRTHTGYGTDEGGTTNRHVDREPYDPSIADRYQPGRSSKVWQSGETRLGAFTLSPALFDRVLARWSGVGGSTMTPSVDSRVLNRLFHTPGRELALDPATEDRLPPDRRGHWKVANGRLYSARSNPDRPNSGDEYYTYKVIDFEPMTVSLVARQTGNRLEPYCAPHRPTQGFSIIEFDAYSAGEMFESAHDSLIRGRWTTRSVVLLALTTAGVLVLIGRRERTRLAPVGG